MSHELQVEWLSKTLAVVEAARRLDLEYTLRGDLLEKLRACLSALFLDHPTGKPYYTAEAANYEHKLVWGNDRRAQWPLELRRNKTTSAVEWRYNGSKWSADSIPAEISALFDDGGRG